MRKFHRSQLSEKQEVNKFSPLSSLSKTRLATTLKKTRKQKLKAQKQLEDIKSRIQNERLEVSQDVHNKFKRVLDGCEMEEGSFVKKCWEEQQKAFQQRSGGVRWSNDGPLCFTQPESISLPLST